MQHTVKYMVNMFIFGTCSSEDKLQVELYTLYTQLDNSFILVIVNVPVGKRRI